MKKIMVLLVGWICAASAIAEKRYVTDQLWLQLRAGPSTEYRILKALRSGTHLIFLEDHADGQYTKVQTDKGLEGYVLSRFLVNEPVAKEQLILTQRELDKIKQDFDNLKSRHDELKKSLASEQRLKTTITDEASKATEELERIKKVSANAIALDEKNKEMLKRTQELEYEVDTLSAQNDRLEDERDTSWLLAGGGLVVGGLVLGLILPRIRSSRGGAGWS